MPKYFSNFFDGKLVAHPSVKKQWLIRFEDKFYGEPLVTSDQEVINLKFQDYFFEKAYTGFNENGLETLLIIKAGFTFTPQFGGSGSGQRYTVMGRNDFLDSVYIKVNVVDGNEVPSFSLQIPDGDDFNDANAIDVSLNLNETTYQELLKTLSFGNFSNSFLTLYFSIKDGALFLKRASDAPCRLLTKESPTKPRYGLPDILYYPKMVLPTEVIEYDFGEDPYEFFKIKRYLGEKLKTFSLFLVNGNSDLFLRSKTKPKFELINSNYDGRLHQWMNEELDV